ncbi:nuclear autoantigenic sperm protein isoform X1 [Sigmodon hispidus]
MKDQVATSESELEKAVFEQLSGQEVQVSPVVDAEAGLDVSEKPGQEITILPNNGSVGGPSVAGDQTPSEPQTERLTETKDGSSVEEVKAELVPEQEDVMLPVEESEADGDGVETKVAQRATEKEPEEKFKIAANEEIQERDEQIKEGEETEASEEEDKENDKAAETPNESVLEKKKIEDAKESQRSGNVAELALKATLVESSSSGSTPSGAERRGREPRKDDAKKAKQEPELNGGSGDAVSRGNEVSENMEAENEAESLATAEGTVEFTATVEGTAC